MPQKGDRKIFDGAEKICRTCHEIKTIDKFPIRADGKATRPHCKKCLYARANGSPAGYEARRRYILKTKYNLTIEEFHAIQQEQDFKCAICNGKPKANGVLYVDHCHDTQTVRGLLCNTCNAGLGQFSDSIELLKSAISYLLRTR